MADLASLPPKRRGFVLAYLGEAQGNATEAARIAGYAHPGTAGHRLLQNVDVAAALESAREETTADGILTARECAVILSGIATGMVMETETNLAGEPSGERAPRIADRIAAIKQLSKMRGYEAPKRVEHAAAQLAPEELLRKLDDLQRRIRQEVRDVKGRELPEGDRDE